RFSRDWSSDVCSSDLDAIDPGTGFFRDTARSYWSTEVDGATASSGGAASVIPENNAERKVYTYYEGSVSRSLTHSANNVVTNNSDNLTKALLDRKSVV